MSPQWGFEQLTPITGRLTLDGAYIPMEMRTIFPVHPELNQLSQVMQIDFDELLAGYMDPSGDLSCVSGFPDLVGAGSAGR
nr:hypothetical protein [Schaalia odontolytica]